MSMKVICVSVMDAYNERICVRTNSRYEGVNFVCADADAVSKRMLVSDRCRS